MLLERKPEEESLPHDKKKTKWGEIALLGVSTLLPTLFLGAMVYGEIRNSKKREVDERAAIQEIAKSKREIVEISDCLRDHANTILADKQKDPDKKSVTDHAIDTIPQCVWTRKTHTKYESMTHEQQLMDAQKLCLQAETKDIDQLGNEKDAAEASKRLQGIISKCQIDIMERNHLL